MIFSLLNIYILFSIYLFTKKKKAHPLSEVILVVFTLFTSQIIVTQLILGIIGALTYSYLLTINLLISTIFIYCSKEYITYSHKIITRDLHTFINWIKSSLTPYNGFLILMFFMASVWIALAAYLLPPRAIDDITYHLTTIIEFIKQGKIFILPLEYRHHVTMPLNAEFLFMWPLIFFKNDYTIGLIQYVVALVGMVVIYRFSRLFSNNSKTSLFAALLFIFTPVVLAQSGAAYIDLIVSVFFLLALYFSTKYYLSGKIEYLYLAALSIGLLSGMKYNVLLLVLSLQVLIFPLLLKSGKRALIIYVALIFLTGSYWYVRNLTQFGNFFPFLDLILRTSDFKSPGPLSVEYLFSVFIEKIQLLFVRDIGIGSIHGGYGINFWAIALPCWVFCLIKSLRLVKEKKLFPVYIWLQLILGFAFVFLSPVSRLYYRGRYSIFMVAIALIALANVIEYYKNNKIYRNIVIYACCIFALFSFIQFANTQIPSYSVDIPIKDRISSNKEYSKMRYLLFTRMDMAYIWETLDFITSNYEYGLKTYFAMTHKDFATPFYGTRFNNSIWNFDTDYSQSPDALVFQLKEGYPIRYLKKKITIEQTTYNSDYQMIDKAGNSFLFIHNKHLTLNKNIKKSLLIHYENYYEDEINILQKNIDLLEKDIPVVTSSYVGFVFLYLNLSGFINNKIYLIPQKYLNKFIKTQRVDRFYSIDFLPKNYSSEEVFNFNIENAKITIFKNSAK